VYYDQEDRIHVSGHGSSKELKLMISITKPRFFMPVHGEFKHMKAHTDIAESLGIKPSRILIAECGDVLELTQNSFRKSGKVELSQIYIDGNEIGDASSDVIKDRHAMSTDGVVVISLVISEGMLLRDPDISTRGVLHESNSQIVETIRKDVRAQVKKMLKKNTHALELETNLKNNLKNVLYRLTKRNSLIIVQVLEV
jgi:ribonuclease J